VQSGGLPAILPPVASLLADDYADNRTWLPASRAFLDEVVQAVDEECLSGGKDSEEDFGDHVTLPTPPYTYFRLRMEDVPQGTPGGVPGRVVIDASNAMR
jgi:hypothetical protein